MGTLTDIFAAQPSDAAAYRAVRFAELFTKENSFAALQTRGITPVELELLWALLEKKRWSPKRHMLVLSDQIAIDDPCLPKSVRQLTKEFLKLMTLASAGRPVRDESVLLRFPQDFVYLLAKLDTAALSDVASRWKRALDRRKGAQWSNSFASRTLRAIASRARKVSKSGPQLFVWVSP